MGHDKDKRQTGGGPGSGRGWEGQCGSPRAPPQDRRVPSQTFPQSSQRLLGQLGRHSWFKVF